MVLGDLGKMPRCESISALKTQRRLVIALQSLVCKLQRDAILLHERQHREVVQTQDCGCIIHCTAPPQDIQRHRVVIPETFPCMLQRTAVLSHGGLRNYEVPLQECVCKLKREAVLRRRSSPPLTPLRATKTGAWMQLRSASACDLLLVIKAAESAVISGARSADSA